MKMTDRHWCHHEAQQCFLLAAAAMVEPTHEAKKRALLHGAMALIHLAAADPDYRVRDEVCEMLQAVQKAS